MSASTINQYPVAPQKRIEAGGRHRLAPHRTETGGRHKAPSRLTRFLGRIGSGLKGNSPETGPEVTEQTAPVFTRDSQMIAAEAARIETTSPTEITRHREVMRKLSDERLPKAETATTEPKPEQTDEDSSATVPDEPKGTLPQRVRSTAAAFNQLGSVEADVVDTHEPTHRAEYSEDETPLAGRHRAIVHRLGRHALDIPAIDANQVHEAALPAEVYEPKHRA